MEETNIFREFLYKKLDTIEYALEINENTLFLEKIAYILNEFNLTDFYAIKMNQKEKISHLEDLKDIYKKQVYH